jgi:hypothetical protein
MDDWMRVLIAGAYDINLPTLAITQGPSNRFAGSGRLTWDARSGVRVQAITDGAELLQARFGRIDFRLGQLIPLDTYITAMGTSHDGWSVESNPVSLDGYSISTRSPHVVWDFNTHGLTLRRERLTVATDRTLRILFGPCPPHWTRSTVTETQNPRFGSQLWDRDWLLTPSRIGEVAARKLSDDWFEARVTLDQSLSERDTFDVITAIARAFGFVLGKRILFRGYQEEVGDDESRYLVTINQETTRSRLAPPLGDQLEFMGSVEHLLGPAIDFFLTDLGRRVGHHLEMCWDTVDNTMATFLTVVSISLEGLVRLASGGSGPIDPGYAESDREAINAWLTAQAANLSPRFVQRMRGFLGALHHRRPVDVLHDWQRRGFLAVSSDDIESWEVIRHRAAHARLIQGRVPRDELQNRIDRLHRVTNLINRIVLHLIGYRGVYLDYSQPNWPPAEFPPAAATSVAINPEATAESPPCTPPEAAPRSDSHSPAPSEAASELPTVVVAGSDAANLVTPSDAATAPEKPATRSDDQPNTSSQPTMELPEVPAVPSADKK